MTYGSCRPTIRGDFFELIYLGSFSRFTNDLPLSLKSTQKVDTFRNFFLIQAIWFDLKKNFTSCRLFVSTKLAFFRIRIA